jgi:hypothetical protein
VIFLNLDDHGSDLSLGQQPTFDEDQAELRRELCRTKCTCTNHYSSTYQEEYPSAIGQDRIGLEWNFDNQTSSVRRIEADEKYWVKAFDDEHTIAGQSSQFLKALTKPFPANSFE